MTKRESKAELVDLKALLARDQDCLRAMVESVVQLVFRRMRAARAAVSACPPGLLTRESQEGGREGARVPNCEIAQIASISRDWAGGN